MFNVGNKMLVDRLDAHDRLQHLSDQSVDISKCCQDLINARPFGSHPFYIFAHKREIGMDERISMFNQDLTASLTDLSHKKRWESLDKVPTARIIWQPRLTRPKPQTNSMLFKGYPGEDTVKVIWIIPPRELWGQYDKEKMTSNQVVAESIHDFQFNRAKLEAPEDDDLNDDQIDAIYLDINQAAKMKKIRNKQWSPILY
jgi:hypothetical protein